MKFAIILGSALLSGCITTQEMQLAPNVVQLNTEASGALFVGHAGDVTLQKAAKATLSNGYDFFKLQNAQIGNTQQFLGVSTTSSATAYGNGYGVFANGSSFSAPVYRQQHEIGVTVVMFHAGESGAKDAFDARQIITKLGE